MAWANDLVTGVAELLAAAGVGTWSPTGAYPAGTQVAITVGMLPQTPDQAIALNTYTVEDTPGLVDVTVGVQLHCRGTADPRTVNDLADAAYGVLHGAQPGSVRGVLVAQIWRQSAAQLGADQLARLERVENYYVQASRPNSHAL